MTTILFDCVSNPFLVIFVINLCHLVQLCMCRELSCLLKLLDGSICDLFQTVIPTFHLFDETNVGVLGASYYCADGASIFVKLLTWLGCVQDRLVENRKQHCCFKTSWHLFAKSVEGVTRSDCGNYPLLHERCRHEHASLYHAYFV